MNELIKITEKDGIQLVSARDLHLTLGCKERFSRWIERMFEYGFENGVDYTPYQNVHPQNNQEQMDYGLSLDMAKEIAMIQRSDKGKAIRKYFIEVENSLKTLVSVPENFGDALRLAATLQDEKENLQIQLDESKAWYSVKRVIIMGHFNHKQAPSLWRSLKRWHVENDVQIKGIFDANYGEVKTYHKTAWKEVHNIELK